MRNPWLCISIIGGLIAGLILAVNWVGVLALHGIEIPPVLPYLTIGILGSLSSFLVQPPRGSVGIPSGGNGQAVPSPAQAVSPR